MHNFQILSAMCILFISHQTTCPVPRCLLLSWSSPQKPPEIEWPMDRQQPAGWPHIPKPPTWMDARKRLPTVRLKVWPTCYTCCSTCLALRLIYNEKKSHPCLERLIYRLSSWAKSWVPTFDDNRTPNDDSLDNDNDSNNDFIIIVNMYIS